MVQFDNQYRQVKIKVVYYGPALGGKTTCLQHIHQITDPERRSKLYSLATATDRTLFFDLLSVELGRIRGYRLALQLYTVPGQVQYNATRRAVLSGADGVVFVADSQVAQRDANRESLQNLWENLAANGLDRDGIPLVLQYNKRDLQPLLPVEDLEAALNQRKVPSFPSVAVTGEGVMEAFAAICEHTLEAVADKLGVGANPLAVRRLQEQARSALRPFVGEGALPQPADDVEVVRQQAPEQTGQPLGHDTLVSEAVRANLAMTDLSSRLDTMGRQLARQLRVLKAIAEYGQAVSSVRDPRDVLRLLLETAVRQLQLHAASVLILPGSGQLRVAALHRLERDPLLTATDEVGESLAVVLLNEKQPRLFVRDPGEDVQSPFLAAVEAAGFTAALAVPMLAHDQIVGVLVGYADQRRVPFEESDLQLASVLAATAGLGYDNAGAWRRLEELNRGLEAQVAERTRELTESLEDGQRLNAELAQKSDQVEEAYRQLAELDRVKDELIRRISAELSAPVTSLRTAAKLLERNIDAGPEKSSRFVGVISEEADRLAEIIQSVVQASLLAGPSGPPERQALAAGELFRRAIAPLRELAQGRQVQLHVLVPNDLDTVSCDPHAMEVALRAVIKNAIEFSRRGGAVRVEVRRDQLGEQSGLVFKITDAGVGIAENELPQVFDTFWRGGNVAADQHRGIGLGLSIAKRVVESHGGTISIASTVDQGTGVTLTLPQDAGAA